MDTTRRSELEESLRVHQLKLNGRPPALVIEEVLDHAQRIAAVEEYIVLLEERASGLESSQRKYIRLFAVLLERVGIKKSELTDAAVEQSVRAAGQEESSIGPGGVLPEPADAATREALRRARGEVDPGCCGDGC